MFLRNCQGQRNHHVTWSTTPAHYSLKGSKWEWGKMMLTYATQLCDPFIVGFTQVCVASC